MLRTAKPRAGAHPAGASTGLHLFDSSARRAVPPLVRYDCVIAHTRSTPVRHRFVYRSPLWLFDLDRVPELPAPLRIAGRFDAADHWAGDGHWRAGLDAFLVDRGVARPARVLVLTGHRSFGHVFNPLTVYWCYRPDGELDRIVAEVHNTYRGRQAYLLTPDDLGRDEVDKRFYVSPFFAVDGRYRMRISEPGDTLDVVIALEVDGRVPFTATVHGTPRPVGRLGLLSRPLAQLRVAALIKWQGIRLWRRGVPIQPRTRDGEPAPGVVGNLRGESENS